VREKVNAYTALVGNPYVKTSLRRPRCRWKNDIKMSFEEIV
jgi:hypothetical protein